MQDQKHHHHPSRITRQTAGKSGGAQGLFGFAVAQALRHDLMEGRFCGNTPGMSRDMVASRVTAG